MPDPTEYIPLSQSEFQILIALSAESAHGYRIMQAVEEACPGALLGPGTLYGALKRLKTAELIRPVDVEKGSRAAPYEITKLGREVARAESERQRSLLRWAESSGL